MSNRGPREGEAPPLPEPLPLPAADSHCHLDIMGVPVADVLKQAHAVGIERIVQVGIDVPTSHWSADVAAHHDEIWATVALHPNEAPLLAERGELEPALAEIDRLAARPEVRGVGETGLDYFRTGREGQISQQESFRRHIDIAKRHKIALMIHDRDAHGDVLRILHEEGSPDRVVFHCFSGDAEMAKVCADRGYVLSFAGNVTFKNAQPLRDALQVTPLDHLLVETDAPFLTPMPYRGRPNAPYLIPLTLRCIAEVKSVALDAVCAAVATNTGAVYGTD